jgi:hypothetical protein
MSYLYARPRPRACLAPPILALMLLAGCASLHAGGRSISHALAGVRV